MTFPSGQEPRSGMAGSDTEETGTPLLAVWPFPTPPPLVEQAYRELDIALNGTPDQIALLGDLRALPRPWEPATVTDPALQRQLRAWFDDVVLWYNHELAWDPAYSIPPCWPHHPHVLHELALLADQRRHAGRAFDSTPLADWHRYTVPAYIDHSRAQLKSHCTEGHRDWPARSRFIRYQREVVRPEP